MFVVQKGRRLLPQTAVVLFGGEAPRRPEWRDCIRQARFLAAADAGAEMALRQGRYPNLLVGDFDSLPANLLAQCRGSGCQICRLPVHKDLTDGEFLLQCLHKAGWQRLLILGALGGRFDQTLANICIAAPLARQGVEICLAQEDGLLLLLAAEAEPRRLCLQDFAGCTVSLLALGQACGRVELAGFEYPLQGPLSPYTSLAISNVVQQTQATIALQNGCLLVCVSGC